MIPRKEGFQEKRKPAGSTPPPNSAKKSEIRIFLRKKDLVSFSGES
jgi:hypothetical protein